MPSGVYKRPHRVTNTETQAPAGSQEVGRMYKQKRIDAGLTVQQISTESGIERSKLSRMENGRRSWAIWELEAYSSALKKLAKEMVKND